MMIRVPVFTATTVLLIAPVALADSPVNFVYKDGKGNIHAFHFDGKAWRALQLNNGGMTPAPPALSDPAAFAVAPISVLDRAFNRCTSVAPDQRDIVYTGEKGDIHHIYHQHGKWMHGTLNNAGVTSAPPAVGRVAGLLVENKHMAFAYRDADGNIQLICGQGGNWSARRVNNGGLTPAPAAGGDPTLVERENTQCDVVYRDSAGGVQCIHKADGWKAEQLNLGAATEAPAAAADPLPLTSMGKQLDLAYRDANGNLHHLYLAESKWHHEQLNNNGTTTAPLAAGDPAGAVHSGHQLEYVFRDEAGAIQRICRKEGQWSTEKLNEGGLTDAPQAVSDPWIRSAAGPDGDSIHVFYLDAQSNLNQLTCTHGKWSHGMVNSGEHVTMAPPAGALRFY